MNERTLAVKTLVLVLVKRVWPQTTHDCVALCLRKARLHRLAIQREARDLLDGLLSALGVAHAHERLAAHAHVRVRDDGLDGPKVPEQVAQRLAHHCARHAKRVRQRQDASREDERAQTHHQA